MTQVLNALSYAHARNVIHRDIKPANMMLTPSGTVKLMDFGIARAKGDASMTVTGTTLGSLFYMSPEQVKGGTVDPRSDLYSLGVSIYEMVTGELPFKAGSDYSIMTAQLQERPKPPSEVRLGVPPQLNGIILHSMLAGTRRSVSRAPTNSARPSSPFVRAFLLLRERFRRRLHSRPLRFRFHQLQSRQRPLPPLRRSIRWEQRLRRQWLLQFLPLLRLSPCPA